MLNRIPQLKTFTFLENWILFEDDDILVVNKPSGLLSVPGRGTDKHESLLTHLKNYCNNSLIVHRLDMDTSGIMVLAKHKEAHRHLSIQFQERKIQKKYHAICFGKLPVSSGTIHLPMRCDWGNRPKQIIDFIHGKYATTHWKIIKKLIISSKHHAFLVKLIPITGRSHQLRLHMQMLGTPILGDNLYADDVSLQAAKRLLLHASYLNFQHPKNHKKMTFTLAKDLRRHLSKYITVA